MCSETNSIIYMLCIRSRHGRNGMVVGFTTTYTIIQSVLIITKVVSSNPVHGEVYSIQHYVIKFVSDLRQVCLWFSPGTSVSSTNKTYLHDITEILLKVVLNTINHKPPPVMYTNQVYFTF